MFTLAIAGLAVGLIAAALAAVAWYLLRRDLAELERQRLISARPFESALQEVSRVAIQSRQRAEELEAAASAARLAAQRGQEAAELCVQSCRDAVEAARLSAVAAAQTVAEALTGARSAESSAQSALRAAAAADACLRIGEDHAQALRMSTKAAEDTAGSALRSAEASEQAAQSNRALAELGRRAWVHATEFRASLKTQGNENSTLDVRIANLGTTPALELKVTTNFHIEGEVPDDLQLKPRVSNIVLGPGVSFSISHFLRVSPADLAAIGTGRRVLLASGQAEYRDVFGAARQTRWCAIYNYNGNSFAPVEKHNLTT